MEKKQCRVCKNPDATFQDGDPTYQVSCPQCGDYTAYHADNISRVRGNILSWYIRKEHDTIQAQEGTKPFVKITSQDLDRLCTYPEMPLVEKMDALLLAYTNGLSYTKRANPEDKKFIAQIQARDEDEYHYVQRILREKGFIHLDSGGALIQPEGWIHADLLRKKQTDSTQAFIAMWFHDDMKTIYETGIVPAFKDTEINPLRIDKKDHNNKIDDEIIVEIQRSRFVVADFTGHRGGVYFEAGYAMGRGIPVIWTCKKCCLNDLHFDIRQYNMIAWESAEDLRTRLHQRIRATLGEQQ